jgi:hypothetical protein
LQSQNRPRPENRLSISRLDVVHGQLDSPDNLERGVTFIRHHSVLAPSAKAGTANAAAPRNRDLRVHLLFTTASP